MKPIIGVTTFLSEQSKYSSVNKNYIDSIYAAGGLPVNIPIIAGETNYDAYVDMVDGILFTGGNDIAPYFFGENPVKQLHSMSSVRDEYELALFKGAYEKNMPIFGICRGIQLINVALEGTLYQDIYSQVPGALGHYPEHTAADEFYHSVQITGGTKLHEIFGTDRIFTNSFHHQSVKALGKNLVTTAFSEDGIVEAVESTEDRFLLGVQWHPEAMTNRHPMFLGLFTRFVQESLAYKQRGVSV
ncbi:gamma-glutamyl-gamma-aminobutyrate hydrolase family protein [Brevibacillus choshinensis]|uniref:Gamma-glutamyl-gamma-aminobutyrate hydrolase family protein n=1 Tax=Brevibacillus choshinensis TaxID=54911 RepID=A0ABX7FM27_BRECH|nr:gamma-glutamyl-gamma-aminobutyrate hydrolase family protein [Brevibacillus choshinensis]QRG66788.1 gamma-glutamyl-gamma-aminobutyrate hydrolase family protein [Brevibacillus choshinensis]